MSYLAPRLLELLRTKAGEPMDVVGLAIALRPTQTDVVAAIVHLAAEGLVDPVTLLPTPTDAERNTRGTSDDQGAAAEVPEVGLANGPAVERKERTSDTASSTSVTVLPPARELLPTGAELYRTVIAEVEARGLSLNEAGQQIFGEGKGGKLWVLKKGAAQPVRQKTFAKVQAWLANRPEIRESADDDGGEPSPEEASGDAGTQPLASDDLPPALPTGAELAAKLDALVEEHDLSRSRISNHLFGCTNGFANLRKAMPRPKTVEKIQAFLLEPGSLDQFRPKRSGGNHRAAAAPLRRDPTQKPDTPLMDLADRQALAGAQRGASVRRGQEEEAARKVDAGEAPKNSFERSLMNNITARREDEARKQDPVEQAKLALQRKGLTVYSAAVSGGRKDRFIVSGQQSELNPSELLDLAEKKTGQSFRRSR